jgi:AraC-like DNA-binding protein/type III secretory pathway component EscS
MLYIIGIFIAFFLAILVLTKKGRTRADIFFGIWMMVIGIHIFAYYSFASGMIYQYTDLMWLNLPYPFLHGPLLYLYTEALTNPERIKPQKWFLHFILPILKTISIIPFMFLPENERIVIYQHNGEGYEGYFDMLNWSMLLDTSGIVYIVITNILLYKHKKRILNQFSNQEKINLNWLRFLFYGMALTWVIIIFLGNDEWIFSTATVFLVFIGYFGIKQVGIFTDQNIDIEPIEELTLEDFNTIEPNVGKKKYAKSGLNEDAAKELYQNLQHLMATERLFIEPELTLTDLATRLEIHPNYLSQVINELAGVNFYDYINTLRIEEFKRLVSIPENQKYTFLALAYDCGFNSKSAFNRYFKKVTNLSPSEYIKSIN